MFFCAIFNSDSRAYNIRSLAAHEAGAEQRHKGDREDNAHGNMDQHSLTVRCDMWYDFTNDILLKGYRW